LSFALVLLAIFPCLSRFTLSAFFFHPYRVPDDGFTVDLEEWEDEEFDDLLYDEPLLATFIAD